MSLLEANKVQRHVVLASNAMLPSKACEKGTPTCAAGEGPAVRGSTQGVWGLDLVKKVLPRGEVHSSGVWGLKLANKVLPCVLLGTGGAPRTGECTIRKFGACSLRKGYSHGGCSGEGPGATWKSSLGAPKLQKV